MSRTQKILFFVTGWLIVLMPFLFWWNTWFGRQLSNQQLTAYLHDDKKPRHIQQALVQISERISRHDAAVAQWYPELVALAADPVEEVRNTDAWVMGQDTSGAGFHETLREDAQRFFAHGARKCRAVSGALRRRHRASANRSPAAAGADHRPTSRTHRRFRSARHGDPPGRTDREAASSNSGASQTVIEIRSPIPGRIRSVAGTGTNVTAGAEIAVVDPGTEQVWEALRALYLIGQLDDLPAIRPYERDLPDISNDVRQQAQETEKAIQQRAK